MNLFPTRGKAHPSMRLASLRQLLLAMLLAGCSPGKDSIDEQALQARVEYQNAHPTAAEFAPSPSRGSLIPEVSSFLLGPDDIVKISVLNQPDLNIVEPVRPDGKIAFFPTGDLQAAGRTVEQLRDQIVRRLRAKSGRSYRLGIQDVIEIKVYGHEDLDSTQTIGPDGTISILPGGSIRAAGKTVDELGDEISKRVSSVVQNPILNVSVKEYKSQPLFISDPVVNVVIDEINSRRISVLGAVRTPGIVKLRAPTTLLDAIAQAGGLSDDADLRQSIVLQDGKILPVSLERLFKQGDIRQNIYLRPNSSVFVASSSFNSAYVIGEVQRSGKITWEGQLSLMDAVGLAGGFNTKAKVDHVLVISGGIADPTLKLVDVGGFLYRGQLENNVALARGDIVYVPMTELGTSERYLDYAVKVFQPILSAESAVVLGGSVVNTFQGKTTVGTSINLNP
jgi:protein involved in polysaccharide export with SLBB domain